jgi:hypothetical protein
MECVLQNHGLLRKMNLSFVENTDHIVFAFELTEMGCELPVLVPQCAAPFPCQQTAAGLQ